MHAVFHQLLFALVFTLALNTATSGRAEAEEFKYYVWIDEEGIVHASEEAPKGRDYKVRIIEDINANVVPAEDFKPYGDLPAGSGGGTGGEPAPSESAASGRSGEADGQESQPGQ